MNRPFNFSDESIVSKIMHIYLLNLFFQCIFGNITYFHVGNTQFHSICPEFVIPYD